MSSQTRKPRKKQPTASSPLETLYAKFLKAFYEKPDRDRAAVFAKELEAKLASTQEIADSIRGEEIRSLLAEFHEDFAEAARCREAEIRKILELHSLTVNTPHWEVVSRQYDFSDVSDRLDLLATLYDRQGETTRAIATLKESKAYCASHGIEFDGQDLLDELEQNG